MALVTYERTGEIQTALSKVLTDSGYVDVTGSPFLGSIVGALRDAISTEYGRMYQIAQNVDLGRATGEYLDRWGNFLNEPRSTLNYVSDLSLNNVSIYLDPTVLAGQITLQGDGISLPAGLALTDSANEITVETLDEIYMRPDRSRVFCRVISLTPGAVEIPSGKITSVGYNLSDLNNVLPSAIADYTLKAHNAYNISGGEELANDEDYRYVLLKKAESIGLFNESKIQSLMDIPEIVKIYIQEYRGGANVYVETKNIQTVGTVVHNIRTGLQQHRSLGLCVNVYEPITRYFSGSIKLGLKEEDETNMTQQTFVSNYVDAVNGVAMGAAVNLETLLDDVVNRSDNVESARILSGSYGGRELVRYNIGQYFNEKILTSEDRISIS